MLSYTERRNLYGLLTVDDSTENLALGDTLMNEAEKRIVNSRAWPFLQRTFTTTTVANQQFYNLPVNYKKLLGNPTITVGSILYTPGEAPDRRTWDLINSVTNTSSDIPQFFFIFNKQIGFYPRPSTAGNTITLPYAIITRDLSVADHTTGSIVSIANGATTVTGTGTSWTSGMAGRFIQISEDNSATSGDNQWYEVASVTSATVLELSIPYEGVSITGATQAYTIAQMSALPDGYDQLPIYKAVEQYYIQEDDIDRSRDFKVQYNELFDVMVQDQGTKTDSVVVDEEPVIKNPNLYIRK